MAVCGLTGMKVVIGRRQHHPVLPHLVKDGGAGYFERFNYNRKRTCAIRLATVVSRLAGGMSSVPACCRPGEWWLGRLC